MTMTPSGPDVFEFFAGFHGLQNNARGEMGDVSDYWVCPLGSPLEFVGSPNSGMQGF